MSKKAIDISIQIVTHNELNKTIDRITDLSIELKEQLSFEIIVIDNASTDNTYNTIKELFPHVIIERNEIGRYFSKGHNQAFSFSSGRYNLILCPDILPDPGIILELFNYLEKNKDIGGVSPCLVSESGNPVTTIWDRHSFSDIILYKMPQFFLLSKLGLMPTSSGKRISMEKAHHVDVIRSAIFLVRHEVFEKAKGYDESMQMYLSDDDLCHKIKFMGYKLAIIPSLKAVHEGTIHDRVNLEILKIAWCDSYHYSLKYFNKLQAYIVYVFGGFEYYLTLAKRRF